MLVKIFNNDPPFYDISLENIIDIGQLVALTNQGIAHITDTKYDEAYKIFEAVLLMKSDYAPAVYNKAVVLEKLGDFKGALDFYKKAEKLDKTYHG